MKQNKTLFNQIFEKFQTLNEADEQLTQYQLPSPAQNTQNEDTDADFDDNSSDEVIE